LAIRILTPTPGKTTTEQILEQIQNNPQGLTIGELQQELHRPVSMLQICLRGLMADKLIKKRKRGMQLVYYSVQ
jgi:predicted transcriptional regulator